MIATVLLSMLRSSTPFIPLTEVGPGVGAGLKLELTLPGGKTHQLELSLLQEESLVSPDLFDSPEWQAWTDCKDFSSFSRTFPGVRLYDNSSSLIGRGVLERMPLRVNLATLKLELDEERSHVPEFKLVTFPLVLRGAQICLDIAGKPLPIGTDMLWFVPRNGSQDTIESNDRTQKFALGRLPWTDGSTLPVLMSQRSESSNSKESAHPWFALWDTMTYRGDAVEVGWNPNWPLRDRVVSLAFSLPLRFQSDGARCVTSYESRMPEMESDAPSDLLETVVFLSIDGHPISGNLNTDADYRSLYHAAVRNSPVYAFEALYRGNVIPIRFNMGGNGVAGKFELAGSP